MESQEMVLFERASTLNDKMVMNDDSNAISELLDSCCVE